MWFSQSSTKSARERREDRGFIVTSSASRPRPLLVLLLRHLRSRRPPRPSRAPIDEREPRTRSCVEEEDDGERKEEEGRGEEKERKEEDADQHRKEGRTKETHRMISLHSSIPLGIPSLPLPPSSLISFTSLNPFLQLGTPTSLSSCVVFRYTSATFVSALLLNVGCDKSGAETAITEPRGGWERDHWRANSPAQEPPWAYPKRWSWEGCQLRPVIGGGEGEEEDEAEVEGRGAVRYSKILVRQWRVAEGLGLRITTEGRRVRKSGITANGRETLEEGGGWTEKKGARGRTHSRQADRTSPTTATPLPPIAGCVRVLAVTRRRFEGG